MRIYTVLILSTLHCAGCGGQAGDLSGPGGSGGGGGQTPIVPDPLPSQPPSPALSGLLALAAGDSIIRADFGLPGTNFEAALFTSTVRSNVFAGPPDHILTTANHLVFAAPNDTTFVGMGIRATGGSAWTQVGQILRCRPSTTNIYVDPTANPATANGQSPATAFNNLAQGFFAAAAAASFSSGANVLIRDGDYTNGPFPLGPDVHAYGGFQDGFDFEDRDPRGGGTRLINASDPARMIVDVLSGGDDSVLDGMVVDGGNVFTEGIDVTDSDCEMRSVTSRRMLDRGSRVRTFDFTTRRLVLMVACDISENGNDGLGVNGVVDLKIDRCSFNANQQEGIDADDLFVNGADSATCVITGSRFFGNGLDGLDIDLAAPPLAAQSPGGTFDVRIEGCSFERNGLDGLIIDQDYDTFPNWQASILIAGCDARANSQAGVHIDADNPGDYVIQRLRSTANKGDGLLVTSETNAGLVSCSASYLAGNQGHGARTTLGNKMLLMTHCVFAGNSLGGFLADAVTTVPGYSIGSAVSCIAWQQPNPFSNVRTAACFIEESDNPFEEAPEQFTVVSALGPGGLTVASTTGLEPGDTVEVADDNVARSVTSVTSTEIVIAPTPTTLVIPESLAQFDENSVTEDLRLATNSPARGTGLAAPGAPLVDPGLYGSVSGGNAGIPDPLANPTLHLLAISPNLVTGVTTGQAIVLTFDRTLDPTSVTPDRVHVTNQGGASLAAGITVTTNQLQISAPVGGWPTIVNIALLPGIRSANGTQFDGALLLPFHRP